MHGGAEKREVKQKCEAQIQRLHKRAKALGGSKECKRALGTCFAAGVFTGGAAVKPCLLGLKRERLSARALTPLKR